MSLDPQNKKAIVRYFWAAANEWLDDVTADMTTIKERADELNTAGLALNDHVRSVVDLLVEEYGKASGFASGYRVCHHCLKPFECWGCEYCRDCFHTHFNTDFAPDDTKEQDPTGIPF